MTRANVRATKSSKSKPTCEVENLRAAGFRKIGDWVTSANKITLDGEVPEEPGVYAFAIGSEVRYVGVASRSLKQRLNFYRNAGKSQVTNIRIRQLILDELGARQEVEVLAAVPGSSEWNGLPVDMATGLEAGIIGKFRLPWNQRGA